MLITGNSIFASTLYAVFSDHILFYDIIAVCNENVMFWNFLAN